MEAIKLIEQYWLQLKRLAIYAQFCVESDIHAPVCHDFWIWTAYASAGLGLLIAVMIGKKILKEQLEFRRNRKRLEARKIVADPETIEHARWKGEDAAEVELSQEELAARMREAINAQAKSAATNTKSGG